MVESKKFIRNGMIFLTISMIILFSGCTDQEEKKPSEDTILTIYDDIGSPQTFTLDDLKSLITITGISQFQNQFSNWRGYGTYEGVKISTLLEEVGVINDNCIINVTATDGYSVYYTYDNVYPTGEYATIQGDMILAYSLNGTEIPDYEDGLRIVFLPDDEGYSNDDMVSTTSLESRGTVPSGGSRWIKYVEKIEIINDNQSITLVGSEKSVTYTLTQLKLMSIQGYGSFYRSSMGTVSGPNQYTGVNLTNLLDDLEGFDSSFSFKVTASDDYSRTLTFDQCKGYFETFDESGNSLGIEKLIPVLAFESPDDEAVPPFRLVILDPDGTADVTAITLSGYWVVDLVSFEIVEEEPSEDTILTIYDGIGSSQTFTLDDLKNLTTVTGTSQFQNQFSNWRGYGTYIGVNISTLLEEVGGINDNCIINVTATDGYSVYYTYDNVYPTGEFAAIQGDMILAYSLNGTEIPDFEDGPRIAFLPDDEGYSNDDMACTTSLESRGLVPSGGSRWAKFVEKIEVIYDTQMITLVGSEKTVTYTLTQLKLMSIQGYGSFYRSSMGETSGPNQYTGVNITYLLDNLEGFDSSFSFKVTASDDYSRTLTFDQCKGYFETFDESGNSLGIEKLIPVLAFESPDDESVPPFRLVILDPDGTADATAITSSGYWVIDLVSFEIV